MSGRYSSPLNLTTIETPANPPSGSVLLYFKADGKLYKKNSAGTETLVESTAAGDMLLGTAQVVTGTKTFSPGALLMRNAAGTVTAEPYSDINAPNSLERTISLPDPATPTAGKSVEWTVDGKSLQMKAPDGIITRIGPSVIPVTQLPTWRAAYANRRTAKAIIATIGDSVQEGLGATPTVYQGYLYRLAERAAATQPLVPQAFKSAGTNASATHTTPEWTFAGTGLETDNKWYGIGLKTIQLPAGRTMSTTFHGTSVQVHFATDFGHGTPTITIDGVNYTGPNLSTASFGDGVIWNSTSAVTLTRGIHNITIGPAGAVVRVEGIKPFDADESYGVHVYPGGRSGLRTADWAQDQFGATLQPAKQWPNAYAAVSPHLVIIALGHNDYFFQTPVATYQANLQIIIDAIRLQANPDPSILLEIYPKRNDDPGTITYLWSQYVDAMRNVAAANPDCAVLDFRDYLGQTVGSDPYDIYFDNVHPNNKGYQLMADASVDALGLEHDKSTNEKNTSPELNLSYEWSTGTPTPPPSGMKIFTRHRARRIPAFVGPAGQDSRLQPALFSNNVTLIRAQVNSTVLSTVGAIPVVAQFSTGVTAATVPNAVAHATTNLYTSLVKARLNTSTTAQTVGRLSVPPQWSVSTTANMGGFHFVARFGTATGATGTRGFVGMSSNASAYAMATNPSGFLNQIGFFWDNSGTTLRFISNGAATGTAIDLGANFPTNVATTHFYEVAIFVASGAGQGGFWHATRIADGVQASGTFGTVGGTALTTVPLSSVALGGVCAVGNGALAATHSMDVQSMYIESDN